MPGMDANPNVIGPATLSVTQAVAAFFTFLPSIKEVRQAGPNDDTAKDVRTGEIAASVVALGVGTIITAITGSPTPVFVALVIVGVLVLVYEVTLRRVS